MATGVGPPNANRCCDERDEDRQQEQPLVHPRRVIRQPHRGGYDCEFVERPPKALQCDCPVCLLVLCEPHQVTCCGYSFCATCVKRVQEDKKFCPTCNEANFSVFPNKGLKRTLSEYHVYCCQRGEGCEWVGELGQLDRHLNLKPPPEKLLVGCQFCEVDCTYCIQPFQRRYVQAHQSDDCLKRPYACQHCNKYEATFEEVAQNHWPVCPFLPLSCPNNCELVLQRQEMEHHVSRDCPLTLVCCDFHTIGCHIQLSRRDMPSHINENLAKHMSLLQLHMMSHPNENMATCMCLLVGSIKKVVEENTGIRNELRRSQEKLQETCDELQLSQETVAQLEIAVAYQNVMIKSQAAILNEHEKILEKVTYTGTLPFEFTMTEFKQRKKSSDEWHSPPFYTHTYGYRMCIRVMANGLESGEGTHLSVYGCLMQGKFDDDLQWPFQGAITIQLINQLENDNHHTHTINFTGTTNPNIISRITSGERAQSGWGNHTFLSHTQLDLKTDGNCQFLKDDQLMFRVSKATNLDPTARICRRCQALESFAGAIEPQVCVAPIEFILSDFERQKKQNDAWHSPAFYTHPRGYRMCVKVYPNGRGNGLGTHLSIFTYILQGPFDGDLKWPFRGNITIQIVNRIRGDDHEEKIFSYTDQTPDDTAGRMTDKKSSLGWGFPQFLSHCSLDYDGVRNTQYWQGDSLQIRISMVELKI